MNKILPTPQQMIEHLDIFVHGQTEAKRSLAKSIYFHYLNLVISSEQKNRVHPEHAILLGPTGSGKTLIAKTLGEYLGVPMFFANAASLTAEGYVGESVSDLLARFQSFCGGDKFQMERGIIFLDEIDKISKKSDTNADVRGEMIQQELLAVLDGNLLKREKSSGHTPGFSVDTRKILVIATGAFDGIDKIVEKRTSLFGFGSKDSNEVDKKTRVESDDLIKYGFLPEFVARFSNIINLDKLTELDFAKILASTEQSPISARQRIFGLHGIELKFSDDALKEIAKQAAKSANGARGLHQQVIKTLDEVEWQLTTLWETGCHQVLVDAACVRGETPPKIIYGEKISLPKAVLMREGVFKRDSEADGALKKGEIIDNRPSDKAEEELSLEEIKQSIDWSDASPKGKKWWDAFVAENNDNLPLVRRLADELIKRKSSINEFFLAYVYSDTDNIQANLYYLDFVRSSKNMPVIADWESPFLKTISEKRKEARALVSFDLCSSRGKLLWEWVERCFGGDASLILNHANQLLNRKIQSADSYFEAGSIALSLNPQAIVDHSDYMGLKKEEIRKDKSDKLSVARNCIEYFELTPFELSSDPLLARVEAHVVQLRNLSRQILISKILKIDELLRSRYSSDWVLSSLGNDQVWHPHEVLQHPAQDWNGLLFDDSLSDWCKALAGYLGELDPIKFCQLAVSDLTISFFQKIEESPQFSLIEPCRSLAKVFKYLIHEKDILGMFLSYLASMQKARESVKLQHALDNLVRLDSAYDICLGAWNQLKESASSSNK